MTEIDLEVEKEDDVTLESDEIFEKLMDDYELLKNKPRLDGKEISGDMHEMDPTVPAWAKSPNKPSYTPEDINAVNSDNVITLEEIDAIFNGL